MSVIYIPCLNVDAPDDGVSFSVGVVPQGGGEGSIVPLPGITISHPDSPFTLTVSPFGPVLMVGINWQWWFDLFGLGETRIQREKETIQEVMTPIFKFMRRGYGFPLHDDHALQFESEYVKKMFKEDPFKEQSKAGMYQAAYPLAQSVFVDESPSTGQRERIVNQFLANAHYNNWPQNAWIWAWNGLLDAAKAGCKDDNGRWMRNPMLVETTAKYAFLLHYMPLANFASAVAEHKVGDKPGRKLLTHWLQNPQLVAGIPQVLEIPPWGVAYKSEQDGGGQSGNPYETQQIAEREPIQQLWEKLDFQKPWYPDLIYLSPQGLYAPTVQIDEAEKPADWDQQDPVPPWPGDNVVEIPPAPQGPQGWPQYPDCPPWNQQPQPDPEPDPQPDPDPGDQTPDDICDPDCQVQIDYLKERVLFLDNWLGYGIVPRIDNLEDWVRDLEHRVPGPLPPLPYPTPFPPWLPPEEIPTDPGDLEIEPPGEGEPPQFTPECAEKLKLLCNPDFFCEEVRRCERELECRDITLCDDTGGPWGAMAECWLDKNTPEPDDLVGVYAGREYPKYAMQAVLFAYDQAFARIGVTGGNPQGGGTGISEQGEQGMVSRYAAVYAPQVLAMFDGAAYEATGAEDIPIEVPTFIYADPADTELAEHHIITVKPHPGEIDPCTGIAEEVLEIPPVEEQP